MSELVLYNQHLAELRSAVALLDTVDEAKDLADKAAAATVWAKRVRLGQDAVNHAAEVKLRAERRAGELLSTTVQMGRPEKVSPAPTLSKLGISREQSSEWQALAAVPEPDFDRAVEEAKADGEVTRAGVMRRAHVVAVMGSSESVEWPTPQELFDVLDAEFGFETDVCAVPEFAKCARFFTPEQDGLAQDWAGTCWMNPPYGDQIAVWMDKALAAGLAGATVVCLVPARVDAGWWWNSARYGQVRFLRGRLKSGKQSWPFPSAVVVFTRGAMPSTEYWDWREDARAAA